MPLLSMGGSQRIKFGDHTCAGDILGGSIFDLFIVNIIL
jgi:hypothetical protein